MFKIGVKRFPEDNHSLAGKFLSALGPYRANAQALQVKVLQAGSGTWQEVNHSLCGTDILPKTDKDFYLIGKDQWSRGHLATNIKKIGESVRDQFPNAIAGSEVYIDFQFYSFKVKETDGSINDYVIRVQELEAWSNFEVGYDFEKEEVAYASSFPDQAVAFKLYIQDGLIITRGLTGLLDVYEELKDKKETTWVRQRDLKISILAYIIKSYDKPLQVKKLFSFETASILYQLMKDKEGVIAVIKARILEHYHERYPTQEALEAYFTRLEEGIQASLNIHSKRITTLEQQLRDAKADLSSRDQNISDIQQQRSQLQDQLQSAQGLIAQQEAELRDLAQARDQALSQSQNLELGLSKQAELQAAKQMVAERIVNYMEVTLTATQRKMMIVACPDLSSASKAIAYCAEWVDWMNSLLQIKEGAHDSDWLDFLIKYEYSNHFESLPAKIQAYLELIDCGLLVGAKQAKLSANMKALLEAVPRLKKAWKDQDDLRNLFKSYQALIDNSPNQPVVVYEGSVQDFHERLIELKPADRQITALLSIYPSFRALLDLCDKYKYIPLIKRIFLDKTKIFYDELELSRSKKSGKRRQADSSPAQFIKAVFHAYRSANLELERPVLFAAHLKAVLSKGWEENPLMAKFSPLLDSSFINQIKKKTQGERRKLIESQIQIAMKHFSEANILDLPVKELEDYLIVLAFISDLIFAMNDLQILQAHILSDFLFVVQKLSDEFKAEEERKAKEKAQEPTLYQKSVALCLREWVGSTKKSNSVKFSDDTTEQQYQIEIERLTDSEKKLMNEVAAQIKPNVNFTVFSYSRALKTLYELLAEKHDIRNQDITFTKLLIAYLNSSSFCWRIQNSFDDFNDDALMEEFIRQINFIINLFAFRFTNPNGKPLPQQVGFACTALNKFPVFKAEITISFRRISNFSAVYFAYQPALTQSSLLSADVFQTFVSDYLDSALYLPAGRLIERQLGQHMVYGKFPALKMKLHCLNESLNVEIRSLESIFKEATFDRWKSLVMLFDGRLRESTQNPSNQILWKKTLEAYKDIFDGLRDALPGYDCVHYLYIHFHFCESHTLFAENEDVRALDHLKCLGFIKHLLMKPNGLSITELTDPTQDETFLCELISIFTRYNPFPVEDRAVNASNVLKMLCMMFSILVSQSGTNPTYYFACKRIFLKLIHKRSEQQISSRSVDFKAVENVLRFSHSTAKSLEEVIHSLREFSCLKLKDFLSSNPKPSPRESVIFFFSNSASLYQDSIKTYENYMQVFSALVGGYHSVLSRVGCPLESYSLKAVLGSCAEASGSSMQGINIGLLSVPPQYAKDPRLVSEIRHMIDLSLSLAPPPRYIP